MVLTISYQEMVSLGTCAPEVNDAHCWKHVLFLIQTCLTVASYH